MDNLEESLLSEQLGSSNVVGRPRIATVTFNTTQPAPVSSTTNAVAMPHPSPHGRLVSTLYTVSQKTCDYIFYNNFNNKCPITIICGLDTGKSMSHRKMVSFPTSFI